MSINIKKVVIGGVGVALLGSCLFVGKYLSMGYDITLENYVNNYQEVVCTPMVGKLLPRENVMFLVNEVSAMEHNKLDAGREADREKYSFYDNVKLSVALVGAKMAVVDYFKMCYGVE